MLVVIIGGLAALIVIAVVVGRASDGNARDSAWRRVADARRINGEIARSNSDRRSELDDRADQLDIREQQLIRCERCPRRQRTPDHRV